MRDFFKRLVLNLALLVLPVLAMAQGTTFPYNLTEPDHMHYLPDELEEVSGLTYFSPNRIAALNDEHGRMYVYDTRVQKIVHKVRFEGDGDFEGIEKVGNYIYAIKSNGKLYRFNLDMTGVVEELDDPFSSQNNIEGLGYDQEGNRLLVALKGESDIKGVKVKGKAVYAFNLENDRFQKTPAYTLRDSDVEKVFGSKKTKIRPSGVAVHPVSGEIYLLASTGRSLIVFHRDGRPKYLLPLKRNLFPQPEGITFSPMGDLFISNEREGEGGTLLHFKMQQKDQTESKKP